MRIGMYGGSFNPPHNGHIFLAKEISSRLRLDKLVIIPSNISPQKHNNGNIDPVHRINMCREVFSDSVFEVSDCEIARGGRSFTFDTLSYLRECYPDSELFLLMGADMLLSFHTWYRFEDISDMCTICAIAREDENNTTVLEEYADTVLAGRRVQVFDIEPFEVSSSEIREKIRSNEPCSGLIDERTEKYIKENRLYEL